MSHRTIEIIVGIVTIVALTVLIIVTASLKRSTIFSRKYPLVVHFTDVKRLQPGAPVYVHGVVSGDVRKIEPTGEKKYPVQVIMMLKKGTVLHAGAHARIVSAGLVGETEVSIEDSSPSAPALSPGDEIFGSPMMDLTDVLKEAPVVVRDLQETVAAVNEILTNEKNRRSFTRLLESASSVTTRINTALGATSGDIPQAIRNVRAATEELKQLITHADMALTTFGREASATNALLGAAIGDLRTSGGVLMHRLSSASSRLESTIERADKLLATAENILAENRGDLRLALQGVTSASVSVAQILAPLKRDSDTLAKIILGPQGAADLGQSLARLNTSMDILENWLRGMDRWLTGAPPDREQLRIPYDAAATRTLRTQE